MGHTDYISSASFSPDGKFIMSASIDKTIRIWDAKTGQQVGEPLEDDTYFWYADFSPDGKYIVSTSWEDGTLRIWDAKSGLQLHLEVCEVCKDDGPAAFSTDVRHIVMKLNDRILILDFPPLQELIDSTTERFKDRELTPEERRKYYLD